jgi:2-dehydro-3-deoxyphosphogluconate aldolase / (4S)-4-hydroxy-2-oxoglutarate aldolase
MRAEELPFSTLLEIVPARTIMLAAQGIDRRGYRRAVAAAGGPSAMKKQQLRNRVEEVGIVPVIRTSSAEDAHFAVQEIAQGGIPVVEVTMTVPGAIDVIRAIVKKSPDVIIGAGTVLDAATAKECIKAGAKFISNPALDVATVQLVKENPDVMMMSGALTPTEILAAWKAGADFVKIFPCSVIGGDNYIRALRRPFPDVPLVAGGGVTQQNAAHYLLAGAAALSIGKEIIPRESMLLHKPDRIRELTRRFAGIVRTTRARLAEAQQTPQLATH